MAKKTAPLLPATSELLHRLGQRLRLARLRRRLTAKQVAERAGMVPMTLRNLESGGAGVTMGAYLAVMQVLGVEQDLEQVAATDLLGRQLQDARLPGQQRHVSAFTPAMHSTLSVTEPKAVWESSEPQADRLLDSPSTPSSSKGHFVNAQDLVGLITLPAAATRQAARKVTQEATKKSKGSKS